MTPPDDFERFLSRQTFRPPPAAWKEEILAAAARERPRRSVLPLSRRATAAWSSLAAVWLVLALIHADTPAPPSAAAGQLRLADAAGIMSVQASNVRLLLAQAFHRHTPPTNPQPLP